MNRHIRLAVHVASAFGRFGGRAWRETWTPARVTLVFALLAVALLRWALR